MFIDVTREIKRKLTQKEGNKEVIRSETSRNLIRIPTG